MQPFVEKNPSPELLELLAEECDGGNGEFESYLPAHLAAMSAESDATFVCYLGEDSKSVVWEQIF